MKMMYTFDVHFHTEKATVFVVVVVFTFLSKEITANYYNREKKKKCGDHFNV